MNQFIQTLTEFWELVVSICLGFAAFLKWVYHRKKNRQESTQMLYDALEKLRQKVILQVSKEVEQVEILAEKNRIIDELRLKCPECYESVIQKIESNENSR